MCIEHTAVWTTDIERLKSFYETYFGAGAGMKYISPSGQFHPYFLSFEMGARMEAVSMLFTRASRAEGARRFTNE